MSARRGVVHPEQPTSPPSGPSPPPPSMPLFASVPFSNASTSLAAAEAQRAGLRGREARVLGALITAFDNDRALGRVVMGATAHEVVRITGLSMQTVTARIRGLVLKGLAAETDGRRESPTGHPCIVWRPTFGDPVAVERRSQTHGRIAAAVRRTWQEAAAQLDAEAGRAGQPSTPREALSRMAMVFRQRAARVDGGDA